MKVLLAHNYYQQRGGEDSVFDQSVELLQADASFSIDTFTVSNDLISSKFQAMKAGFNVSKGNPQILKRFEDKLDQFRPDVLHVHNFFPLLSPEIFSIAKKRGISTVLTLHNFRLFCANALLLREGSPCTLCIEGSPLQALGHRCYRDSLLQTIPLTQMIMRRKSEWNKLIDRFICLSQFSREIFEKSGIHSDQLNIIPNFLHSKKIENYPMRSDFNGKTKFLYAGRLSPEKGIESLVNEFKTLPFELHVFGEGPLLSQLSSRSTSNVFFHGRVSQNELIKRLPEFTATMIPSICYENFPVILAESFSMGVPVIARNIGSFQSWVSPFKNGILYDKTCVNEVLQLAGDQALQKNLSMNAKNTYLSTFTETQHSQSLNHIYSKIIKK